MACRNHHTAARGFDLARLISLTLPVASVRSWPTPGIAQFRGDCRARSGRPPPEVDYPKPNRLNRNLREMRAERVASNELESCLNQAFRQARSAHLEFLTLEHLLLEILDTPKVREVLQGCGADSDKLGTELQQHIAANNLLWVPLPGEDHPVQPQLGFRRVLQRAAFDVKSSGKVEVGVENVLMAIFSEQQSRAALLLTRYGITGLDVVNCLQTGPQA
jgi:hypothetical protein